MNEFRLDRVQFGDDTYTGKLNKFRGRSKVYIRYFKNTYVHIYIYNI